MKQALLISCFEWYEERIEPIVELIDKDYNVTVLTSDYSHIKKKKIISTNKDLTYIHVVPYKKNVSVSRIISHLQFGIKVKKYINQIKPDLIYLLLPPNNTALYCSKYKKKNPDSKYIVDIIDMWPESMPIGKVKNTFIGDIWRKPRNEAIQSADLILTECDLYQEKLSTIVDKKLCYSSYLFKNQNEAEKKAINNVLNRYHRQEDLCLGYVGSINNLIDIDKICNIIQKLIDSGISVKCKIIGDGNHRDEFVSRLKKICETMYFGPIFDEDKKITILSDCDFGLNIMKSNVSVGLTIKSMDYLSYGLPLLNNIKGDTWKLVDTESLGVNINEVNEELVLCITKYKGNRNHVHEVFEKNFSRDSYKENINKILRELGVLYGGNINCYV